jgi:hypothetical protein
MPFSRDRVCAERVVARDLVSTSYTRLEKGDVPVAIFGETLDDDLLSAHLGCWSGLRLLFERASG